MPGGSQSPSPPPKRYVFKPRTATHIPGGSMKVSNLVRVSALGMILGIFIIYIAVMQANTELDKIGQSYVLTTLASYPDELAEFGRVLRVDRGVAEKVLTSSAKVYANLSVLPDVTILVMVASKSVKQQGVHVYVKPRTVCLGSISPACLALMKRGQPAVLLNSEEVGYVDGVALEVPELTSMLLEINNIEAERIASNKSRLWAIGIAVAVAFAILGFAGILLPKHSTAQALQNKA